MNIAFDTQKSVSNDLKRPDISKDISNQPNFNKLNYIFSFFRQLIKTQLIFDSVSVRVDVFLPLLGLI